MFKVLKRPGVVLLATSAIFLIFGNFANAQPANISNSFLSDSTITSGSLVSLVPNKNEYVEAANTTDARTLVGVVVTSKESLLAINEQKGTIQVAINGDVPAFVSTLNGSINVGDGIAVSPIDGVGMKATTGSRIIGFALQPFDGSQSGAVQEVIDDSNGGSHQISVGEIPVSISVGYYYSPSSSGNSFIDALNGTANVLIGHDVSTIRLFLTLGLLLISIISVAVILYGAVKGGVSGISRNPLAKPAILKIMTKVIIIISFIAIGTFAGVFLLLQ